MWLAYLSAQENASFDWTVAASVIAAGLALIGVVLTAWVTLRTSSRSEDSKREEAFDDRQDAELARVTAERDRKQDEVDRIREQYDRLWAARQATLEREAVYRQWIRQQGCDPDEVLTSG